MNQSGDENWITYGAVKSKIWFPSYFIFNLFKYIVVVIRVPYFQIVLYTINILITYIIIYIKYNLYVQI